MNRVSHLTFLSRKPKPYMCYEYELRDEWYHEWYVYYYVL
jgi:hypothetical protein